VLRLAELSASDCKKLVCRLCKKALCCDLTRGRRIKARCMQISFPMQSYFYGSVHVRRLKEDNKEEEELVDVAPHRGEPRTSCVVIALCY
jgi:hypothetical protein